MLLSPQPPCPLLRQSQVSCSSLGTNCKSKTLTLIQVLGERLRVSVDLLCLQESPRAKPCLYLNPRNESSSRHFLPAQSQEEGGCQFLPRCGLALVISICVGNWIEVSKPSIYSDLKLFTWRSCWCFFSIMLYKYNSLNLLILFLFQHEELFSTALSLHTGVSRSVVRCHKKFVTSNRFSEACEVFAFFF